MTNYNNASKLLKFFYIDLCGNVDFSEFSLSEMKEMIQDIKEDHQGSIALNVINDYFDKEDLPDSKAITLLRTCLDAVDCSFEDLEYYEFFKLLDQFTDYINGNCEDDFYIDDLPCGEVRLIHESEIDDIWKESLIEMIKDCYDLSDVPSFVEIDWEATAKNCMVDGKGHHFASYDHQEHYSNGFYIFRIN